MGRSEGVQSREGKGVWEEEDRVMDSRDQEARDMKMLQISGSGQKIKLLRHLTLKPRVFHMLMVFQAAFTNSDDASEAALGVNTASSQHSLPHHS